MNFEAYCAASSTELYVDAFIRPIPDDPTIVELIPVDIPEDPTRKITVPKAALLDIQPSDRATILGARVGSPVRVRVRSMDLIASTWADDTVYPIDWQSLLEQRVLPDGDRISLSFEALPPGTLGGEVALTLGSDVTWWKQVEVYNFTNNQYRRVAHAESENDHAEHRAAFGNGGLESGRVVLWKAKTFGIHRQKYILSNIKDQLIGRAVRFTWLDD